jgi:hypothetical protein
MRAVSHSLLQLPDLINISISTSPHQLLQNATAYPMAGKIQIYSTA